MNRSNACDSDALWNELAPCLDNALAQLSEMERDLILWRYFERRTAEQIGARLGLTTEGYRVLSQRDDGPDTATLTVQFQYPNSRVRENELSFYRDAEGVWRQAMPRGVMDKLPSVAASLSGQAQGSTGGK